MEHSANAIYDIIRDYRSHDGIVMSVEGIIKWANQFGDDAGFVLSELAHVLPEVYVSREKAKSNIKDHIEKYIKRYEYVSIAAFLSDAEFLSMQDAHKSQPAILSLVDEVLAEQYGDSYLNYTTFPKKHFIYFDDVLASGSTIGKDLVEWLYCEDDKGQVNAAKVLANEIIISVCLFCCHSWGKGFQEHRINKSFEEKFVGRVGDKIKWYSNYEIQNHVKLWNQRYNMAKPIKGEDVIINTYYAGLTATKNQEYAFRDVNKPAKETFFSSPGNRVKFENILLLKGIEIINMIKGEVKTNIRPLGLINPTYKVLGLGTHFFTWRNIPNNCPLVYWWEVPGHDWIPLFSVNRG